MYTDVFITTQCLLLLQVTNELCSKGYKASYFEVDGSEKDQCVAMVKTFASANDGNVTKCPSSCELCRLPWLQTHNCWEERSEWDLQCECSYKLIIYSWKRWRKQTNVLWTLLASQSFWVPWNHWTNAASKGAILIVTKHMALDLFVNGINRIEFYKS